MRIWQGVLFNYEWIEVCKDLPPDDFKQLFFAIVDYQKNGTPFPVFTGTLKIISTLIFPCVQNRVESAILGKQGAIKRWESPPNSPPINQDKISKDKISKDKINISIEKTNKELENQFNEFWDVYPKKASKPYAKKIYLKIAPSAELHAIMLNAIKVQKQSKQWQDAQYIPNPSTWLNQEKWNDETTPIDNKYARLETTGNELLEIIKTIK